MGFLTEAMRKLTHRLAFSGGIRKATLTGNETLTKLSSQFQALDPGGSSRNLTLPTVNATDDDYFFCFHNTADADENLVIKNPAGSTIQTIPRGATGWVYVVAGVWTAGSVTGASGLTTDVISEATAAAGVTIDGCLVKDGRVAALATAAIFHSTEVTGNGGAQNTAHGLGATPTLVFAYFTELDGNAADIAAGTHDATNAVFTVTSGQKYRVVALK